MWKYDVIRKTESTSSEGDRAGGISFLTLKILMKFEGVIPNGRTKYVLGVLKWRFLRFDQYVAIS